MLVRVTLEPNFWVTFKDLADNGAEAHPKTTHIIRSAVWIHREEPYPLKLELVIHPGAPERSVGVATDRLQRVFSTVRDETTGDFAGVFRVLVFEPDGNNFSK